MLKQLAFVWLFCQISVATIAQQAKVSLEASPLDAIVLLDGDTLGLANDRKVYLGFNERKGICKHRLTVMAKGFEREVVELRQDAPTSQNLKVHLKRKVPKIQTHQDFTVDLLDVLSGIEYGTSLGGYDRWLYRYNSGVLDLKAKDQLHEALETVQLTLADSVGPEKRLDDSAHIMVSSNHRIIKEAQRLTPVLWAFNGFFMIV